MIPPRGKDGLRHYGGLDYDHGAPEDLARCAEQVPKPSSYRGRQCSRKRGHGPGGELCRQHAARRARREAERKADR